MEGLHMQMNFIRSVVGGVIFHHVLNDPSRTDTDHFLLTTRFDEVHFGKFAGKYIKTRYFVDVHPPLAKLLITLAAFVFGFNGDFDFADIAKYVCIITPCNAPSL